MVNRDAFFSAMNEESLRVCFFAQDSDSDVETNEIIEQRTSERRIEQQLDDFRAKWKKEIQQRTVYGHVLQDKQQQEEEVTDQEEQVGRSVKKRRYLQSIDFRKRQNISFNGRRN